jgi:hypothetical protein
MYSVFFVISTAFLNLAKIKKQIEAEIASSAEHLLKETFYSDLQKERWGVTQSQAHPLCSLEHRAVGKASEANWKPVILSKGIKVWVCS